MRARFITVALAFLFGAVFLASDVHPATSVLSVKTIKAGLRTATPEEGDFIERVVALAEEGKLPPELVESTFQWARKKPYFRFQYFKRGLTYRAAKAGISL